MELGGPVVIGYLPGLYPEEAKFDRQVEVLVNHSIAALEVGIPGRTPPLEGDTISGALAAVQQLVPDPVKVLRLSMALTACDGAYPIAMAFAETAAEIGLPRFVREAAAAGASALLVPDIPEDGREELHTLALEHGVQTVLFQGAEEPLKGLYGSEAFMYLQTADMPTGGRFQPTEALGRRIRSLREESVIDGKPVPLALGFGIKEREDVEAAHRLGADIAVVGTALVEAASNGLAYFERYVESLAGQDGRRKR
jgi:tryptophan synthase alpha chain